MSPSTDVKNELEYRAAICIGPEHGTVEALLSKKAAKEAVQSVGFGVLMVCGFGFDADPWDHPAATENGNRLDFSKTV